MLTGVYSPVDYDEELARVIATATAAKTAIPGIKVAAPSTCAWWYCKPQMLCLFNKYLIRVDVQIGPVKSASLITQHTITWTSCRGFSLK